MLRSIAKFGMAAGLSLVPAHSSAAAPSITFPPALQKSWEGLATSDRIPYEARLWVQAILKGSFRDAAHNWGVVKNVFPTDQRTLARTTYLFLLWNENLAQTLVDQLLVDLDDRQFLTSAPWQALGSALLATVPALLEEQAVQFRPDQKTKIDSWSWTNPFVDFKAWSLIRDKSQVALVLQNLPAQHRLRGRLEVAAALQEALAGQVDTAISRLEAAFAGLPDPSPLRAAYDLELARLYYQKADLAQAQSHFLKVPVDSPLAPDAREGLLWVWLRTGDTAKLRGTILSLAGEEFKTRFLPEMYVVRAISDLKLCRYDEAKADFAAFSAVNHPWAEQIDQALKATDPARPPHVDWYTELLDKGIAARTAERDTVQHLFIESVAASLPSVGEQVHWAEAVKALEVHAATLKARRTAEYRRQWRNDGLMLSEAIRKLRFVKVELMAQIAAGMSSKPDTEASQQSAAAAAASVNTEAEGHWSFPFDGVNWPDEVFAARSAAGSVCL